MDVIPLGINSTGVRPSSRHGQRGVQPPGDVPRIPRSVPRHVSGGLERKEFVMKRALLAVAVLTWIVPCLVSGQANPQKAAPAKSVSVEQQLIKLEQDWANAYVTRDIQILNRAMADDFIYTDPDGTLFTKAQDLEEVKTGVFVATSFVPDDITVRVYGDAAVVTGRNTIKAQYKGKDASGQSRWTDTWIKRGGVWRCVATHSSKIAAPLADETAIRQEVSQRVKDYIAVCERVDSAATLRFVADVPEFRYADTDGKQYDYAGFTKLVTDLFAGLSAQKATTRNQEILVLGPDTALVIWHGAMDAVQKDGSALRWADYNFTGLFKRLGGTWKIVFQNESGLPPAPPTSAQRKP
jgi:ketosteroid isomerase-like protein